MVKSKKSSFIGINLNPDIIKRLDIKAKKLATNRSQIIRLAIIQYLDGENLWDA